jgi:hypothetical protein
MTKAKAATQSGAPPAKIARGQNKVTKSKASAFFASIPWDEWKDEFMSQIDANGKYTYRTAYSFAKAKAKDEWEKGIIYEAIGPTPKPAGNGSRVYMAVSWLGDWLKERDERFWSMSEEKLAKLQNSFDENQQVRASLGKIAPSAFKMIMRLEAVAESADRFMNGMLLMPGLDTKDNRQRAKMYLDIMERVIMMQRSAMEQYCMAHGLHPKMSDPWTHMAMVSLAREAGTVGLELQAGTIDVKQGKTNGAAIGASDVPAEMNVLAGHLKWIAAATTMTAKKAANFGLPLPDVLGEDNNDLKTMVIPSKGKQQ